jgi:hypothetical protein
MVLKYAHVLFTVALAVVASYRLSSVTDPYHNQSPTAQRHLEGVLQSMQAFRCELVALYTLMLLAAHLHAARRLFAEAVRMWLAHSLMLCMHAGCPTGKVLPPPHATVAAVLP